MREEKSRAFSKIVGLAWGREKPLFVINNIVGCPFISRRYEHAYPAFLSCPANLNTGFRVLTPGSWLLTSAFSLHTLQFIIQHCCNVKPLRYDFVNPWVQDRSMLSQGRLWLRASEPVEGRGTETCIRNRLEWGTSVLFRSNSLIERHNWTVRTAMRRYTRLSNGFSRKLENHAAAVALNYFAYNFIQIHRTLRTSPAMRAGVTDCLWSVADLVAPWESEERRAERAA
jgi:hypothetical protein